MKNLNGDDFERNVYSAFLYAVPAGLAYNPPADGVWAAWDWLTAELMS